MGYREVKQAIFEKFMDRFGAARRKRQELEKQPEYIGEALRQGVARARAIGAPLVREVRNAAGIADATCFKK
jgi:tryptophanyl-tRNA synthetase